MDVSLKNITKTYDSGHVVAVNDVSFDVKKGELFGLIGPDGAGKTTIFRMLTTLLVPDKGQATVAGFDIVNEYKAIRNRVGYMPGKFSLYKDLTVRENLSFFANIFSTTIDDNYDLIKDIYDQIKPFSDRRAGKLSGGMKQKLALCCALIHKPEVLLLDEPTTGVDVVSRKEFWAMLKNLKKQGITILVSTPYMDEANLCERIALIQKGKIMTVDTPDNIIRSFPKPLYRIKSDHIYQLIKDLDDMPEIESCYAFGEYLHITLINSDLNDEKITSMAVKKGHTGVVVEEISAGIEDSFIRLMNDQETLSNPA